MYDKTNDKTMVSIIIPTYNVEKYIGVVLDNILAQTYDAWEAIVVDDGSTDNTYQIVCDYARREKRIIAIKREVEEKGSLVCRNIGQRVVKGKYFIHFDSDDIIEPFCLRQRVEFMESHPELDYATFKGQTIIQQSDGSFKYEGRAWGEDPGKDMLSCFLSTKYPFSVWNNIYRTNSFINYYWDEKVKIYTDFSYIVPTILEGKKHAFDNNSKPDYLYRMGQGNAMTSSFISDDKYDSTKYLFDKTWNAIAPKYKKDFKIFFVLQFRRLLENGRREQVSDYYNFFKLYYPRLGTRLSILLLYWKANQDMSLNYRVNVKRLGYIFFEKKAVYSWIKAKIYHKFYKIKG